MRIPTTKRQFARFLRGRFDAIQFWLDHPAGVDEQDFYDCADTLNEASAIARRLGAGERSERPRRAITHHHAQAVIGRLLAWCQEEGPEEPKAGVPLTVKQAAKALNVGERTIHRHTQEGRIPHHRIGSGRGTIRIRPDDLTAFERETVSAGKKKPGVTLAQLLKL